MTHSEIEEQDLVDRYLMKKLPPDLEKAFVEHFLSCPACLDQLQTNHELIALIRRGPDAAFDHAYRQSRGRRFRLPLPAWGLAAAFGIAALYLSVHRPRRPVGPPMPSAPPAAAVPVVQLQSYRSGGAPASKLGAAAARQRFVLRLDARGLAPSGDFWIEIVAESGERVWSATAPAVGEWLDVRVENARLPPGDYWVRLWRPEKDLLREYPLVISP